MINVRLKFKKEGRARYISHLDLNRFMIRAIRRASIPVWYTEGFNTHPYIVFGLPLSLGYSSESEHMDFKLEGDLSIEEVQERFSKQMPEGLDMISVREAVKKISEIEYASSPYFSMKQQRELLKAKLKKFLRVNTSSSKKNQKVG